MQTVFAGFAAFTSGIKAGDRLESVDGISVYTLEPAELKALTMGREGTNALVKVRRGEDVFEVCLVRSLDRCPVLSCGSLKSSSLDVR